MCYTYGKCDSHFPYTSQIALLSYYIGWMFIKVNSGRSSHQLLKIRLTRPEWNWGAFNKIDRKMFFIFSSAGKIIIMLLMPSSLRIYLQQREKKMLYFRVEQKKKYYSMSHFDGIRSGGPDYRVAFFFYSPFSRIYFIVSLWSASFYSLVLFFRFAFSFSRCVSVIYVIIFILTLFFFLFFVFVCVHLYRERLRAQRIKLGNGYVSIQWASY